MFSIITNSKGRGLVANEDIEEGTLILSEYPSYLAQYPINKKHFPACPKCLAPIQHVNKYLKKMLNVETEYEQCMDAVECPSCNIQYCTPLHLESDILHSALCGNSAFNELIRWWSVVHGMPEWTTPELPLRICFDLILRNKDFAVAFSESEISGFVHSIKNPYYEEEVIDHLTSKSFLEYFDLCQKSFREGTFVLFGSPIDLPMNIFKSIILACALNGQGAGTSPLDALRIMADFEDEVMEELAMDLQTEYHEFTHCEGTALYPTHALINHSCDPNAVCQFTNLNESDLQDAKIEVLAIRNIPKGSEIYISYNESDDKSRYNFEMYKFVCQCQICHVER